MGKVNTGWMARNQLCGNLRDGLSAILWQSGSISDNSRHLPSFCAESSKHVLIQLAYQLN